MCKAKADRFDDLTYCNRSDLLTLRDHRDFVLAGTAWKNGTQRPSEGLNLTSLQRELKARGVPVIGKHRPHFIADLEELRAGIATFPVLTATEPETPLESYNLHYYEVGAVEPLHDFKGHMANLFEEIIALTANDSPLSTEINNIKEIVLKKEMC